MRIGVPKEIKVHEYRVGLIPSSVRELVQRGHEVVVEAGAGLGAGLSDDQYRQAGAAIGASAEDIYASADMIVKVKEPVGAERALLRKEQILFAYLHLAPDKDLTAALLESGAVCIAYETVTSPAGTLPLLMPMSEVAGRMAVHVGAYCLEKERGGRGILLGGVPGVPPSDVVILGGGTAGSNAALIALGMGATVTVIDRSAEVLRRLSAQFGTRLRTIFSTRDVIEHAVAGADLVIGTVLVPGSKTPSLVSAEMVKGMKAGAVVVDVAIDQGGCFETSRVTTHAEPTFIVDEVVHYCVANMPGAVARTSTFALNNVTLPFALALADKGYRQALCDDPFLRAGLNICAGKVTLEAVASAHDLPYREAQNVLNC